MNVDKCKELGLDMTIDLYVGVLPPAWRRSDNVMRFFLTRGCPQFAGRDVNPFNAVISG